MRKSEAPLCGASFSPAQASLARSRGLRAALSLATDRPRRLRCPRARSRRLLADAGNARNRRGAGADRAFVVGPHRAVKPLLPRHWNGSFVAVSGPSRRDACMRALRPKHTLIGTPADHREGGESDHRSWLHDVSRPGSFAELVDPTRSQNMTVIGRRSAVAGDDAGAGLGGLAAVSVVPRAAIALSRRLRSPNSTPN
jgi:hypothetical protein